MSTKREFLCSLQWQINICIFEIWNISIDVNRIMFYVSILTLNFWYRTMKNEAIDGKIPTVFYCYCWCCCASIQFFNNVYLVIFKKKIFWHKCDHTHIIWNEQNIQNENVSILFANIILSSRLRHRRRRRRRYIASNHVCTLARAHFPHLF